MKIGFIGLGKMGRRMVLRLLEQEVEVVVWNRSPEPIENLKFEISNLNSNLKLKIKNSLAISQSIDDLVEKLETPRIIWLMVTAGQAVDSVIEELSEKLTPGDLVIDGGNSFYKDTLRRAKLLGSRNIHFMDVGTSGGVESARSGACLMVGGSKEDFKRAEEVLKALAAPQAYGLLGPVGARQFLGVQNSTMILEKFLEYTVLDQLLNLD
ncbi:MAG: NAD(P)-binding domain-containing protein [Candidatus Levybacteria bacterium]|nr:NAD(P)-binding domain-containing protein [Candidatus Levybacteria bacterium]